MSVWDRVAGQDRAVGLLRAELDAGRVAHAYLLSGMAGDAPLRTALALAAACVCADGGCSECRDCRLVGLGSHPDVDVVEPAGTQLLVDQVRDVVRAAWRVPTGGRRRVIVVDQADRMNPNAQNAFLKALEEPPESTVIVLVAPAAEALLPTVRSRCREIALNPPSEAQVAAALRADGLGEPDAAATARIAGTLERARELASDEEAVRQRDALVDRVLHPLRDPGEALEAAEQLAGHARTIRDRVAESRKAQAEEHSDWFRETKKAADDRLRREQRRAEQDALERALDDVTVALRDLLAVAVDPDAPLLDERRRAAAAQRAGRLGSTGPASVLACLDEVEEARRRLRSNANVQLALERVFVTLYERLA